MDFHLNRNLELTWIKLLNEENGNVEAVMCKRCELIIRNFSIDVQQEHTFKCMETMDDYLCLTERLQNDIRNSHTTADNVMDFDDDINCEDAKEDMNKKLTAFFCACNIPYRIVENQYFIRFVDALCKTRYSYKPPCRQTLASSCINRLYEEIIDNRKKVLRGSSSVLLIDGWRNSTINRKFIVCTLRNVKVNQTFLKFYDASLEREDGEYLSEIITDAINFAKEFYESDVFAIKSDNDAKLLRGGRLVQLSNEPLWQSTCTSHSANLLLKSLVDASLAIKIREVIQVFRDPKVDALIIKFGGTLLRNYPETRFCYLRDSALSIVKNIEILRKISLRNDVDIREDVISSIHDDDFLSQLTDMIELVEPVCKLINKAQDPTCNIADATDMWLSLKFQDEKHQQLFEERQRRALRPVDFAANVLHPKYAGSILSIEQNQMAYEFFVSKMDSETLRELHEFLADKEELRPLQIKCQKPLVFWKLCKVFFPNLSKFAIKLNLIPASTAQLESYFSKWTFVHNLYRNRLTPINSSKLVDIYSSLK